ncbi:hypothetical protein GCM10023336_69330 [Streptomyces similanensis]|uniref:Uncharacterized protein n=1 Tax=Streptomyces similanensis TaxID=1274988 RepID=A0ABP9LJ96_9ACTN
MFLGARVLHRAQGYYVMLKSSSEPGRGGFAGGRKRADFPSHRARRERGRRGLWARGHGGSGTRRYGGGGARCARTAKGWTVPGRSTPSRGAGVQAVWLCVRP